MSKEPDAKTLHSFKTLADDTDHRVAIAVTDTEGNETRLVIDPGAVTRYDPSLAGSILHLDGSKSGRT